jgi:hypothetical protein
MENTTSLENKVNDKRDASTTQTVLSKGCYDLLKNSVVIPCLYYD